MTPFLLLPFGFQRGRFLLQLGEFSLQFLQPLLARRVLFLLQRLPLHLQLHDLALDHVDFRRHGIELDLQTRSRFVDQIDRFVGQETIADVAMRKDRRGHERGILNAHAVVHFVAFLQSAQNRDRILDRRLVHHHRLKTPFERGVLLDVLAIFVERGRADRAQLAARQLRLQHVGSIDRSFRRAGADDGVQFVDEKNDLALRVGDLFQKSLQPILEFAAKLRARDHRADVQRDELLLLERLRHVAADDAPREAFDDRRLPHPGLADQHRIVLRPAREHLHDATNFVVAANHGIDLSRGAPARSGRGRTSPASDICPQDSDP